MAGEISFSGMSSGIDTASIVDQLVAIERQPIYQLESKKSDLAAQRTKLQDLSSKITTLGDKADTLSDLDSLALFTGTAEDEDVLGVTIDGQARPGIYQVEVTTLAKTDRNYSTSFGSGALGLADGDTLDLTIDGTLTSITLDSADTLDDVANAINSSDADAWATVVGDGAGGGRLLISSNQTGTAQRITFGGAAATTLTMANQQQAIDASITIDGLVTATSTSNHIEDVLEGVSLDLTEEGQTTNITIASDNEAIKETINEFVTAYNDIMSSINNEFAWSGEARTSANLSGDTTLRSIQQQLQIAMTQTLDGLTGNYTSLASIGITSDNDGTLSVDDEDLTSALEDDLTGVKDVFAHNTMTDTYGVAYRLVNAMDGATYSVINSIIDNEVGSLSIRVDGIDQRTEEIDDSIERMEMRLESYEQRLRNQFMEMEITISTLQNQSGYLAGLGSMGGS